MSPLHQTIQTLATLALLWFGTVFFLRRLLPILTSLFSRHFSIRTVSLRSIRGLGWEHSRRRAGREQAVSVRVERIGYNFHRADKARGITSWLTLIVEDVRVVVRDSATAATESPDPPSQPSSPVSPSEPTSPTSPGWPHGSPTPLDASFDTPPASPEPSGSSPMSRSALLSPLLPATLTNFGGSYFSPDLTPSIRARLWSQYKYQARRLAERWLRSALNCLPNLVRVVDIQVVGPTVCRFVQSGAEDEYGTTPSIGLETTIAGSLRLHASIQLSTPPSSARGDASSQPAREDLNPWAPGAHRTAKRLRSSAATLLRRGLGRAAGTASVVLDFGPDGTVDVRALHGGEAQQGLKRVSSGLAWFGSMGRDGKGRSDGSTPRRNTSFASLSAFTPSSSGPDSPKAAETTPALLSLSGPFRLEAGHCFGPGVGLLFPGAVKVAVGLDGDLAVDGNRLEEFLRRRKAVTNTSPAPEPTPNREPASSGPKKSLLAVGDVQLHAAKIRCAYSGELDDAPPGHPSSRLPLELVLLGMTIDGRASTPDSSRLHREWLGKSLDLRAHNLDARADALQVSVQPPPAEHGSPEAARTGLPSILSFESPSLEAFTTCLGSALNCPANPGLLVCSTHLKSLELGVDVGDVEKLQSMLRKRSQQSASNPAPHRQPEPPPPALVSHILPRVVVASTLGRFKAEIAVPSSSAPDEDHLLAFDCAGASLNVEAGVVDVPRVPKRTGKQTAPPKIWPQDFSAFVDQDVAYHVRTAATIQPLEVGLQVASSRNPSKPATEVAPAVVKMALSEFSSRAVVPGSTSVAWDRSTASFRETTVLRPAAAIGHVHAALGNVAVELWEPELIERLADCSSTLSSLRPAAAPIPSGSTPASGHQASEKLFGRLPAGLTAYVCLAQVDALVAAADPNPACTKKPLRGLWFRTRIVAQFCQLSKHQALQHPTRTASSRTSLQLEEDILIQGVSYTVQSSPAEDRTALVSVTAHETGVRPIFNARRFRTEGSDAAGEFKAFSEMFPKRPPLPQKTASLVGWDRQDPKQGADEPPWASQVRSDPFSLSPAERASSPLRIPLLELRVVLRHSPSGKPSKHLLAVTIPLLNARLDLSHAWAALVAVEGFKSMRPRRAAPAAAKPASSSPARPSTFSERFDVRVDAQLVHLDLELPLGERLFVRVRKLSGSVQGGHAVLAIDSFLGFVPNIRQPTLWDELLSLRTIRLSKLEDGAISISLKTARIKIPYGFKLSQLILNLNVTLKSLRHLLALFKSADFDLLVEPQVQGPKHVPDIRFQCASLCFEAQDDPIETRLNLIWRVGMAEQSARLERQEAFEAKVAAIAKAEGREHSPDTSPHLSHASSRWKFGGKHTVVVDEARERLALYNSTNYVRRFRNALDEHARKEATHLRQIQAPTKKESRLPIDVSPMSHCSPMFRMTFFGTRINVTPPSFPLEDLAAFLHDSGAGLPKDTEFSLLVPLHLSWSMDTARVILRDYPVPLFNLPPMTAADDASAQAFQFESDVVIGEEMAGPDSFFWIPTAVIPADLGVKGAAAFELKVAKTIMPVKTYARPTVKFNSSQVTSWGWGSSMQPGVQDMMKVFETLTHPPRDPSPRIGFWDKLRLVFHWSVDMSFVGPVHIHAKGSRNPYNIVDHGAGFVLAWSGAPKITINKPNREQELVQIEADNLFFAIPDFRGLLDHRATGFVSTKTKDDRDADGELEDLDPTALYSKICAKFTNGARAGWGFVLERTCTEDDCQSCSGPNLQRQCRIFDFRPHWEVVLRTPEALEQSEGSEKDGLDSYHGFRSDYIHFSMSIVSPTNRHCPGEDGAPTGYNSFHFTPKGFAHFFAWWRLFGGNMSLPIRQGKLFPNSPPPSKKFGKSLATIKYRFEIAPLFISHLYANDRKLDWDQGLGTYLGIKVKLAKFRADLHQREQERTVTNEKLGRTKKIPHKPFYAADIVLDDIDLRAMSVLCREPEKRGVKVVVEDIQEDSVFTAPTALPDPSWRDRDDLVETDRAPSDDKPRIELHQIGVCPRFTFKKRPQSEPLPRKNKDGTSQAEGSAALEETSKFGHEPTHLCHLNQFKDPLQLQIDLARHRLVEVEATLDRLRSGRVAKQDAEVDGIPVDNDKPADRSLLKKIVLLQDHILDLTKELSHSMSHGPHSELSEAAVFQDNKLPVSPLEGADAPEQSDGRPAPETWKNFDNVFQAHYPHITWSNEARNIVLKYYYHSRARRGFEYHMSALAVKFIREMTAQREAKPNVSPTTQHFHPSVPAPVPRKKTSKFSPGRNPGSALANGLLSMLQGDQPEIVDSEEREAKRTFVHHEDGLPPTPDPWEGLSDGMQIQQNHCFILVKPQIALRSSVDDDSVVIIAAMSTNLMMYGVLDERDLDDPVNSRVMRRSYMTMTAMQAFYPADRSQETADFVPLEILLDVRSQTDDFERIIPQTSVSLQYDKFNQLRLRNTARSMRLSSDLSTQDTYHLRHNMDLAVVNIPRLAITSDSNQFASLYNIVTNLLLYQDSVQRERNKRLEDFIYSFDHSNLSGATDIVLDLQHRIRVLERMQTNLRANSDRRRLEHSGELVALKAEKRQLGEELDLLFLAIAAAQDPRDSKDRADSSAFKIEVTSSEISWNMLSADKRLLAKMALKHSKFSHLSLKDSSLINEISIRDLQALNGQPDALFPEMLSRYERQSMRGQPATPALPFLNLKFHLLAPVGGISIIQYFGLQLQPVRVQIERKTGRAIMEYFFQDSGTDSASKKGKKPIVETAFTVSQASTPTPAGRPSQESSRSDPSADTPSSAPPKRSSSTQNLAASGGPLRPLSRCVSSASIGKVDAAGSGLATPRLKASKSNLSLKEQVEKSQAEEMRARASHNRTFVYIEVEASTFVLSYKGERAKNLTDLHDFRFSTPSFVFHNKTWGFQDLVDELKSQMLKAAWSQKGSLVSQIFTKTGRKASAALGYQQDSGSSTSVASSSSSSVKAPDKARTWTPSSSAPENIQAVGVQTPSGSPLAPAGRKSDSLLKRTLHLSKSKSSLSASERSSSSESSSTNGPYIVVSADSDYDSSASSFVSLPSVDVGSEQAKRNALLGSSLAP